MLSTIPSITAAILVVDQATPSASFNSSFEPAGASVVHAATRVEALVAAGKSELSAIIVSLQIDSDALSLVNDLRRRANDPTLPVIFLTETPVQDELLQRIAGLGWANVLDDSNPEAVRARLVDLIELHRQSAVAVHRQMDEHDRRLRAVFEMAHEGIWVLDSDGYIVTANQRMSEIIGHPASLMLQHRLTDFFFPEDIPDCENRLADRRLGRSVTAQEIRLRHADGRAVVSLHSSKPVIRDGEFAGALEMFTDITARRIAEERFKLFFTLSSAGHALVDPRTMLFTDVNQRFADMVGRTPEELMGMTFLDVTHPEDRAQDQRLFGKFVSGESSEVSAEKRYLKPDGTITWVHLTSTVVRDPQGRPEIQLTVVQDITARKRAEADLEENRTRLRLAIEAAELGVFYHNGCTEKETWNDRAKQLIGLRPDEEPSSSAFLEHVHPEDRARVELELLRLLNTRVRRRDFAVQCRIVWPDGSIHFVAVNGNAQVKSSPDGKLGAHVIGTVRDMTAVKEFEIELQRKVEARTRELQDKTSQLETFCYTVAHDLRAPLRAINGYADIISEEFEAAAMHGNARDYLERIKHSTRRLDTLIRDLLTYSRMTDMTVNLEPVGLAAVVRAALRELEPEIKRVGAGITVQEPLPTVLAERSILEQVVVNLISNAVKFVQPGTTPRVDVFAETHDDQVRLLVRDNGIGIAREYHDRIFRMFERLQAAREYPGTGIGLAIVARAMQRMGGSLGLTSEPSQGSTFWIQLRGTSP